MTPSPSMLPVSGEQHEKALKAAIWAFDDPRCCMEQAEAVLAAYLAKLSEQGARFVEASEVERLTIERNEMRRANITPEDAARPLGQSVEYWQDRCLDHASALDETRVKLKATERKAVDRAGFVREVAEWLRELDASGAVANYRDDQFTQTFLARFGGGDER